MDLSIKYHLGKYQKAMFLWMMLMPLYAHALRDSAFRSQIAYPGYFISVGFTDRLNKPSTDPVRISYFNEGRVDRDTFSFYDPLKSNRNLVNFTLSGGLSNRYVGVKLDLGFVPFANRNSHQNIAAFALLPIHKNIILSPFVGLSRLRKQKKIGELTGKDQTIYFQDQLFDEINIRVQQISSTYHYGLGVYFQVEENVSLYLACQYHQPLSSRYRLKVTGFKDESSESVFESIVSADAVKRYADGDPEVKFRSMKNQNLQALYRPDKLAFLIQVVFTLESGTSNGYSPKKFMGTQ